MRTEHVIAAAEVAAVLLAGAAILMSLRGLRDQLWLVTFAEYTRRYSEIVRSLPSESRRPGGDFDVNALPADDRAHVENAVREYMNLCSEEFYLHARHKIDDETWAIWRKGIQETVRLPWIQESWSSIRVEYTYYPEFCVFLDACVEAGVATREGMGRPSDSGSKGAENRPGTVDGDTADAEPSGG